jgi:gliding motility-associated-like protein
MNRAVVSVGFCFRLLCGTLAIVCLWGWPTAEVFAQSCDCPALSTCGACQGGFVSMTLRFNGTTASTITASDDEEQLFSGVIQPGGTFTVSGSRDDGRFDDSELDIDVEGSDNAQFETNCDTHVGDVDGSFTIVAAVSRDGGPVCCLPASLETEPPAIAGCPVNLNVALPASACTSVVNWTAPTASDNCELETFTSTHQPGATFSPGVTAVTYTATDIYGNIATCAFNVTVTDNTAPVITGCPTDITASPGNGCEAMVTWTLPTATDNCSATLSSNHNPGMFAVGTTTVTYTATDPAGNQQTCSFNVIVTDTTDPVITGCPSNITVAPSGASCNTAVATWTVPTVTDNCTTALSSTHEPGTAFPLGTTDQAGNQQTCSFSVIVSDTSTPVFTACPANLTVAPSGTECNTAVAAWTAPTVTDNCTATVTSSHAPGATFPLGTTAVTYAATDAAGNTASCTFNVVVEDTSNPVITGCPANITLQATGGDACNTAVATWTAPTATDNCVATLTSTHTPGATFTVGTTAVTYTATDQAGNISQCSFNVVVQEATDPVITGCPSNITKQADNGSCGAVVTWTAPTVSGGCASTLTSTHQPGATFALGTTTVTYTATNPAGKTATCSFNVIVVDTSAPVFTGCPANISLPASDASCNSAIATWTPPTVTDGCPTTLTSNHLPGATFTGGITVVTYTATDQAGNVARCSFNVIVLNAASPAISKCPDNMTIDATAACSAVATWTPPTATAGCGTTVSSTHAPGDSFPLGTTLVTYTVKDKVGNVATCSFNVTVRDITAPVFSGCPTDITVEAGDACAGTATWTPPSVSDNCSAGVTSTHNPGTAFPVGTTTVTYTAIDTKANKTTCSFKVTVGDTTPPVFTGCPANVAVTTNTCNATATWTPPVASDKCTSLVTTDRLPGSVFPAGVTTVTYTAKDQNGNVSKCSFTVTVIDNAPPVITGCPSNINLETNGCAATASWTPPGVTDNCGVAVVSSHKPGDAFPLGTTAVTYTATDASGTPSTCTFNVKVSSTQPPILSECPDDIVAATFEKGKVVTWSEPQAAAQCGELIVTSTHQSGAEFPIGRTQVIYEFADKSGRTITCSFSVTIEDQPVLVDVSKALTPDGDGINDTWWLGKIEDFHDNRVIVVDRWGNQVYQATGYDNTNVMWNGIGTNGARVPTGTYFYTIELRTSLTVVQQKGSIEVIQ